jgi:hypothetical protein
MGPSIFSGKKRTFYLRTGAAPRQTARRRVDFAPETRYVHEAMNNNWHKTYPMTFVQAIRLDAGLRFTSSCLMAPHRA